MSGTEFWIVLAVCTSLKGTCAFSPPEPLRSPEACAQYGRRLQLSRGLPMNAFECPKIAIKRIDHG